MGNCFSTPLEKFSSLDESGADLEEARAQRYADASTTCRIFHVNDIYILDHLPKLKTVLDQARKDAVAEGIPAQNCFACLAGDFLAPSLLSSLDAGKAMIGCLNRLGIEYVTFGNHECDIPLTAQAKRIEEFKGIWINTNMPGYQIELPEVELVKLRPSAKSGKDRTLALISLLMDNPASYGDGVYGGAERKIVPPIEAGPQWYEKIKQEHGDKVDTIVPITHQSLANDAKLAQTGLFPVLPAGHDHDLCTETYTTTGNNKSVPVLKAGQNAENMVIIDLVWSKDLPSGSDPEVSYRVQSVTDQPEDAKMKAFCFKAMAPVRALQKAVIHIVEEENGLSNDLVRIQPSPPNGAASVAVKLCSVVRSCMMTDACFMFCGFFKDKDLELKQGEGWKYADLQKVTPRNPELIIVRMPGSILDACIWKTRQAWVENPNTEQGLALQVCDSLTLVDHHVTHIDREPLDAKKMYTVATVGYCANKLKELVPQYAEYMDTGGGVIPDDDGRPWMTVLIQEFAALLLALLIDKDGDGQVTEEELIEFAETVDTDQSGKISRDEITKVVEARVGVKSDVIVDKLMNLMDDDRDDLITIAELRKATSELSSHDLLTEFQKKPQVATDLDAVQEA